MDAQGDEARQPDRDESQEDHGRTAEDEEAAVGTGIVSPVVEDEKNGEDEEHDDHAEEHEPQSQLQQQSQPDPRQSAFRRISAFFGIGSPSPSSSQPQPNPSASASASGSASQSHPVAAASASRAHAVVLVSASQPLPVTSAPDLQPPGQPPSAGPLHDSPRKIFRADEPANKDDDRPERLKPQFPPRLLRSDQSDWRPVGTSRGNPNPINGQPQRPSQGPTPAEQNSPDDLTPEERERLIRPVLNKIRTAMSSSHGSYEAPDFPRPESDSSDISSVKWQREKRQKAELEAKEADLKDWRDARIEEFESRWDGPKFYKKQKEDRALMKFVKDGHEKTREERVWKEKVYEEFKWASGVGMVKDVEEKYDQNGETMNGERVTDEEREKDRGRDGEESSGDAIGRGDKEYEVPWRPQFRPGVLLKSKFWEMA